VFAPIPLEALENNVSVVYMSVTVVTAIYSRSNTKHPYKLHYYTLKCFDSCIDSDGILSRFAVVPQFSAVPCGAGIALVV